MRTITLKKYALVSIHVVLLYVHCLLNIHCYIAWHIDFTEFGEK